MMAMHHFLLAWKTGEFKTSPALGHKQQKVKLDSKNAPHTPIILHILHKES